MSAVQELIIIVEELVGFNTDAKTSLAAIKQQLANEEAEIAALRQGFTAPFDPSGLEAEIAALETRVTALEGATAPVADAGLNARVTALEARNEADDQAAGGLEPTPLPPVTPVPPAPVVITLSPETLPDGQVGVAYAALITGAGGTSPYVLSLAGGALPDGVTLDPAEGLSGTPTAAGASTFTVEATDAGGNNGSIGYSLNIAAAAPATEDAPAPNP